MIKLAVFDSNSSNYQKIKQEILNCSMQDDIDIDLLWFFNNKNNPGNIKKYASIINIALICLDLQDGKSIGKQIYDINEDCRIIYYSSKDCELANLLCVRPCGFYYWEKSIDGLVRHIRTSIADIKISKNYFFYETKKNIFCFPMRTIMYFESNLKYVLIHTEQQIEQIYGKLSDFEPNLYSVFLRIHKTYIVNVKYIRKVDKSRRTIVLLNDEILPISDANYKNVVKKLAEMEIEK